MNKIIDINDVQENEIKYFKRGFHINDKMMKECQEIISLCGLKYLIANGEADSLCAYIGNKTDGVISNDIDILTHGANVLIKDFSFNPKQKIKEIYLNNILKELSFSQKQFIDLCILLGTDYNDNPKGIGPVAALKLIEKYKSISKIPDKDYNFDYKEIRKLFKNEYTFDFKKETYIMKSPKLKELKNLLLNKYNFNEKTITRIVNNLKYYQNQFNFKKLIEVI